MANVKSILVSVFLIFAVGFLFLAQSSEATKGPKITNKVWPFFEAGIAPLLSPVYTDLVIGIY